jgi:hypothetical protein
MPIDGFGAVGLGDVRKAPERNPIDRTRDTHAFVDTVKHLIFPSRSEGHTAKKHQQPAHKRDAGNCVHPNVVRKRSGKNGACHRRKHIYGPTVLAQGRHRILHTQRFLR